jgi:hypothetical protein
VTTGTDDLAAILAERPDAATALRNVAAALLGYTEVRRAHNGRGRARTYAADPDTIAETARQLAETVLAVTAD